MSEEWKVLVILILTVAISLLGIVVADKVQVVRMANRGLCYDVVQMPNKNPENQWEKCK